jgi:hypothetical protein
MFEPRFETQTIPFASYHALGYGASLNLLIIMRIKRILFFTFPQLIKIAWLGILLTAGCIRIERMSTATPVSLDIASTQQPTLTLATNTPDYGWTDVSYLMEGVCFEAALNDVGKVFKLIDDNALNAFYAQINSSQLCEDPVNKVPYAFNDGAIIVGLWSAGTGCTARHAIKNVQRDNTQKQEAIQLQFITEGDCPYELVQPFWISLPQSQGFNVQIDIQSSQ